MRYKGGVISATPPTTSTTSAVGVWTLAQQLQAQGAGNWPTILSDQYFKYVTMLLHGDGTNGAQNNTFLDSSTNNFTITRNGNTTQGSFSPYGSNWSNYFDGTGDSLTIPNNTAFRIGSGDFTVEGWVLFPTAGGIQAIVSQFNSGGTGPGWTIYKKTTDVIEFFGGSGTITVTGTTALTVGAWNHFAVVRNGSTITIYVNGVAGGTGTNSSFTDETTTALYIGARADGAPMTGYISNVRIVKGTAVYTSAFTPPTTPLTAIANTSLLTCQSNRFIDTSTNAFAITRNGDVSVQRFSPFSPTAAYSTSVIGGSGYFDGSGDYLTVANDNTFDTNSTFTLECWFYQPTSGNATLFARGGGAASWSTTDGNQFMLFIESGTLYWQWNNGGPPSISTTAPAAGQWHHVAVGYNGTTTRFWLNGVSVGTSTTSYLLPTTRNIIRAGISPYGTNPLTGYISNLRFVKGTDVYGVGNSTITVSTAPLTAIANTSLLTNFTNGGIFDNAMMNNLETVGNAQISTSVKKFGTGSLAFDGTGDYLKSPSSPNLGMGTGDFTVEAWVYINTATSYAVVVGGPSSDPTWYMEYSSNRGFYFYDGTTSRNGNSSVVTSQWLHLAVARSGTTLKMFVNGTVTATYTTSSSLPQIPIGVGSYNDNVSPLNGYIDDLRITKGYARYTANFTPPTAAFPNQ
jgi:hypothetical protein